MSVNRKKILELYNFGEGLGIRQISETLGNSRNTIRKTIRSAQEMGLARETFTSLDAKEVDDLLKETADAARHRIPDYDYISKELEADADVNLKLLWNEYCADCIREDSTPYQYSRFCSLYKEWAKKSNVTRRIIHKPAYAAQCDWVGSTGRVIEKIYREERKAYFFVMTMPYSGYMYVEAFADMKMVSWIAAHVHAYRFFGGVPTITVPDNLRTGVKKSDRYEPEINETYRQMAEHYGTTIVPTRVYYPKGKAQVERTVRIVETWIIAYLRKIEFNTFADLNEAVLIRVRELNAQEVSNREMTREELFLADERSNLLPLPTTDFENAIWKKATLQQDSHFQFERMRYSAPCSHVGRELDLRVSDSSITVYFNTELLCTHLRLKGRIGQYSTDESHMPEHLRESTNRLWSASGFIAWARRVGPSTADAVKAIIDSKPIVEQAYRSCRGLKSLADRKGNNLLEEACGRALELAKVPSYTQIKNILAAIVDEPLAKPRFNELVDGGIGGIGYIRNPEDYLGHEGSEKND